MFKYTVLGMFTGLLFLGSFPTLSLASVLIVVLTSIIALVIQTLFMIAIGLLSFFIEDANPFYLVYSKVILVLGTIFPIEYFPGILQTILRFSPVYVVSYGPAKLFVDFSWSTAFSIILAQIIYIILAYLLCFVLYKKGVKRINVNGG